MSATDKRKESIKRLFEKTDDAIASYEASIKRKQAAIAELNNELGRFEDEWLKTESCVCGLIDIPCNGHATGGEA